MGNPFALGAIEANRLRPVLDNAVQQNADQAARAVELAKQTNTPVGAVAEHLPEVDRQAQVDYYTQMISGTPATRDWLADPANANMAHDDIPNLSALETTLGYAKKGGSALLSGYAAAGEGWAGQLQAGAEAVQGVLPAGVGTPIVEAFKSIRKNNAAWRDLLMPKADNPYEAGVYSGLASLTQNLLTLPFAVAAGPAVGLGLMAANQGGQSYGRARDLGRDVPAAQLYGAADAAIEYATELLPMHYLLGDVKAGTGFFKMLVHQMSSEIPGEQVATVLQDANEWAVLHPEKTFGDFLKERPDAAIQTAVATAVGVGGQVGLIHAVNSLVGRDQQRVNGAELGAGIVGEINRVAQDSRLRERSPAAFGELVDKIVQETGAEAVYIDARAFAQSGVADEIAAELPGVAEQLATSLASGGEIRIPMRDYVTKIAGNAAFAQPLVDHVRLEGEEFSRQQAAEYMAQHGEALRAEVEAALKRRARDTTWLDSVQAVQDDVLTKLNELGRFEPAVNERYAALYGAYFGTMAERLGVTPEELYRSSGVNFAGANGQGGAFGQFAGENAAGADLHALNRAKSLIAGGQSAEQVRQETGWHKGVDGKWRFEISDGEARLNFDLFDEGVADTNREAVGALGDVLDHPKLFSAYPWLRDVQVRVEIDPATKNHGAYSPASESDYPGLEDLNSNEPARILAVGQTEAAAKSVLLHEIQHAIQSTEGFAVGGSPENAGYRRLAGEIEARNTQARAGMSETERAAISPEITQDVGSRDAIVVFNGHEMASVPANGAGGAFGQHDSPFGPILTEHYHDAAAAIENLKKLQNGDAIAALHHADVGDIDLVWGKAGTGQSDGYGLAKLVKYHPEVLNNLQDILNSMTVVSENKNRIKLESADHTAVIRLTWDNAAKHWLLTAFEKSDAITRTDTGGVTGGDDTARSTIAEDSITEDINKFYQDRRGEFAPGTKTLRLFKAADLSTFLHESGHFFLDLHLSTAQQLEAMQASGEALTPLQQRVLSDANALMRWFGVADLNAWFALSFEQQVAHHEAFAEGFEKYLWRGHAPNLQLANLFGAFRAWLVDVYKRVKNHFGNIDLSADVRDVMDRMLASDEEIRQAQASRAMMPLFENIGQSGMDTDEWAVYQALGDEQRQQAVDDYTARGLRDMQWLSNARDRQLQLLQRKHDAVRRAIRADVRVEVMGQPVYRAWSWLTGRLSAEERAALRPPVGVKLDKSLVNPGVDTLFTAIAKLGGLNKQELVDEWNLDTGGRPAQSAVFGKPVWRRSGGLSIEAMAERLADEGYLAVDEHGKYDLRQFAELFDRSLRSTPVYAVVHDYDHLAAEAMPAGGHVVNPLGLAAARLDHAALMGRLDVPRELRDRVAALGMTARDGFDAQIVAELFGFADADRFVETLATVPTPREAIEAETDRRMLEQYGELATKEARRQAADAALHNEARAKFLATEEEALNAAAGGKRQLQAAAQLFAERVVSRLKMRDVKPYIYERAELRAGKAAVAARTRGNVAEAAAAKRAELFNFWAAREAHGVVDDRDAALRHFRRFKNRDYLKNIGAEYNDQIFALLGMFGLLPVPSGRVESLAAWADRQDENYKTPFIPGWLMDLQQPMDWQDLTVREFRELVDTLHQIEFMGRHVKTMNVIGKGEQFEAIDAKLAAAIIDNAGTHIQQVADLRTANDVAGSRWQQIKSVYYSHIRARTIFNVLDGGKAGGVLFDAFMRPADELGTAEVLAREEYTKKLMAIWQPIYDKHELNKRAFPLDDGRDLTREQVIGVAFNMGNEGNQQRLMSGEGWDLRALHNVIAPLTVREWRAIEATGQLFEEFKPAIVAQSRALYGKATQFVEPRPFTVSAIDDDGTVVELHLSGWYYPIVYDPLASEKSEQFEDITAAQLMLNAARGAPGTQHAYDSSRANRVENRALMLSMDALWRGMNMVIHDLHWRQYLMDANRLLGPGTATANAIRERHGVNAHNQLRYWLEDIAGGDLQSQRKGVAFLAQYLRRNVGSAGLALNVKSALFQLLGVGQSWWHVGTRHFLRGVSDYVAEPEKVGEFIRMKSPLMKTRALTQFRELAEVRNAMRRTSAVERFSDKYGFAMLTAAQLQVDYSTWLGAYYKQLETKPNDDGLAVAVADDAVLQTQGGGHIKDLSSIENNKEEYFRLFTAFYNFMGTKLNMLHRSRKIDDTLPFISTAMFLLGVMAILENVGALMVQAGGDADDDWILHINRWPEWALKELMSLFLIVREIAPFVSALHGQSSEYHGPTGTKMLQDAGNLVNQGVQMELDRAFLTSVINLGGDMGYIPGAAQVNKTVKGVGALAEGETHNPMALVFGVRK